MSTRLLRPASTGRLSGVRHQATEQAAPETLQERREHLAGHVRAVRSRTYASAARAQVASGIARSTYASVEAGRPVRSGTWSMIEELYSWPPGSCEAYLSGRAPLPEQAPLTTVSLPGLPEDVSAVLATRRARTPAEQVAVLQALVLDIVRAADREDPR